MGRQVDSPFLRMEYTEADQNAFICLASYQIYALKPILGAGSADICGNPLLNWWDAYPAVQSENIPKLSTEDVAQYIIDAARVDYAVIDVRRNDHAVSGEMTVHCMAKLTE